jgi:tetratricopeptide (TPR) repeat protein
MRRWIKDQMKHRYLFVFSFALLTRLAAADLTADLAQADEAERGGETDRAIEILKRADNQDHGNAQIEKRLSRLYSWKIEDTNASGDRKNYAELAVRLGEDAVQKLSTDPQTHIALAAAYGEICDMVDSRTRVEYSKRVYREVMRGLELEPSNDYGHLILARWNFEMATTNPVLRGMVQVVYGQFPPASKEEAIENFKKAIALAPNRVIHHAEYAKVLEAMGDMPAAREQWQKVLELKPVDAQDRRYRALAAARLGR